MQFQEEYPTEQTPKMKTPWCKFVVKSIYIALMGAPLVTALFVYWWERSFWIAFLFALFTLLVTGVIVSKMRVRAVPFEQREINYSTLEVVRWYVGKNICTQEQHNN